MRVLLGAVSDPEGIRDAAPADDVQDAYLFCEPDRIPEGDGHGRQQDRQLLRARRDRRSQDVRGRQMSIVGSVDSTAITAPRVSAHAHMSMAAAYKSVAGAAPSGARMSNRRVNISAASKPGCSRRPTLT
jgi:hypothetical protein